MRARVYLVYMKTIGGRTSHTYTHSLIYIYIIYRMKKIRPIKYFMLFLLLFYMFGNDRNLTGFYILNNNFSH